MIYFNNDYSEGCLPEILERLSQTNFEQTPGYGVDFYCKAAADRIRTLCEDPDLAVHFLVGGTQTNLTVIASALRPYQAVVAAVSGHISVHETGAIEATGHKVIELPSDDGKLSVEAVRKEVMHPRETMDSEHMVQPKMVYISQPTELGTLYSRQELAELSKTCRELGLYLFADGARLGYGLTASDNDVTMADMAKYCDVFYIGGTKVGALFGEAVVISNPALNVDFRFMIKQRGGMMAKGRLLGLQFDTLLAEGRYFAVAKKANALADKIRAVLDACGASYLVPTTTNQIFPVLPQAAVDALSEEYCFSDMGAQPDGRRAIRICTSWATREENVALLCNALKSVLHCS